MKLFLIKCGKVIAVIRRDGIVWGVRRAVHGAVTFVRMMWVPKGTVLIITSGIGDSARYRAHHVAEALRRAGIAAQVTVQDNPFLSRYVRRFEVFVFHRVLYMGSAKALYDAAKAAGKTIIVETDDLVYDPKFLRYMDFYTQMQPLERLQYKNGIGGEMVRDPYVRVATVSTSYLAERLREEGKRVFVVPNMLSQQDCARARRLRRHRHVSADTVTIGYFSGVLSHNKDFAILTPVLTEIFQRYKQVRVAIYGPLDLDPALQSYADRFICRPYVPRMKHFANIASVDINIAPLEDNPFCQAKSELKFFEAGIVGVPTVASATQTFREAITQGVDGYVAETTQEWVTALSALIDDASLRERIGAAALRTANKRYTTEALHNHPYTEFLRETLARATVSGHGYNDVHTTNR